MMKAIKILAAGVTVYLGVAACSAASSTSERLAHTGGAAGSTSQPGGAGGAPGGLGGMAAGGAGGSILDSGLDAFADAMGDAMEVPDADAAPPAQVVNAPCDKTVGSQVFAEAAFTGKLVDELATIHAVSNYSTPQVLGYAKAVNVALWVADGKVAALCGGTAAHADSVDFILP